MTDGADATQWVPAPATLTLPQQFRLVEIAHETTDVAVKRAVMELLVNALNPPIRVDSSGANPIDYRADFGIMALEPRW